MSPQTYAPLAASLPDGTSNNAKQSDPSSHLVGSRSNAMPRESFEIGVDDYKGFRHEREAHRHLPRIRPRQQCLELFGKIAFQWTLTVALCGLYILTLYHYGRKDILDEAQKRRFNTWTTALSIAMSLNVASSLKRMTLDLRWWVLSLSRRNLNEVDLILRSDSMTKLTILLLKIRTPAIITFCVLVLLLNILAQAGIAMLSLTYGINQDTDTALLSPGNVSVPNMTYFFPRGNGNPTLLDQAYTAHTYGMLNYWYETDDDIPNPGDTVESTVASMWLMDPNTWEFVFFDSPPSDFGGASIFTNRTINSTYTCESYPITHNGNGNYSQFEVENLGLWNVSITLPNSTVYFTNDEILSCEDPKNARCGIVYVFEASDTQPWFYRCEITVGEVQNALEGFPAQQVTDEMAWIASGSIALQGYRTDVPYSLSQEAQLYPVDTYWGSPLLGNTTAMGQRVSLFALGSIAGAANNNPPAFFYGMQPQTGESLEVSDPIYFFLIIGLLIGGQLILVVVTCILANRVHVQPDSYLAIAHLLNPMTQRLEMKAGAYDKKTWAKAGKGLYTKYSWHEGTGWKLED